MCYDSSLELNAKQSQQQRYGKPSCRGYVRICMSGARHICHALLLLLISIFVAVMWNREMRSCESAASYGITVIYAVLADNRWCFTHGQMVSIYRPAERTEDIDRNEIGHGRTKHMPNFILIDCNCGHRKCGNIKNFVNSCLCSDMIVYMKYSVFICKLNQRRHRSKNLQAGIAIPAGHTYLLRHFYRATLC